MSRRWQSMLLIGTLVLGLAMLAILTRLPSGSRSPAAALTADTSFRDTGPATAPAAPTDEISTAATNPATTTPVTTGGFRGRVIDAATRAPVKQFELRFYSHARTKPGQQDIRTRQFRNDEGRFEWPDISAGRWSLTATARGYQRFELNDLQISAEGIAQEIVLPLRAGLQLRGRVYDESSREGIADASISFRESHVGRFEGNFRSRPRVTSRKDGTFVLDGVPRGSATLEVFAPQYAGRELTVLVDAKTPPLEIGLSAGGAITGHLATADGAAPIAGLAGLHHRDQGFGGTRPTGPDGEFAFEHLGAGRYRLTGQAGAATVTRDIVLGENQRVEGIVLAIGAGRSIRGVITGLEPHQLERTSIRAARADDPGTGGGEVRANANGTYVIHGVPAGRVTVSADVASDRQISKAVEMPADADLTVNLDFPRGFRISGHITRNGKPTTRTWVEPVPLEERKVYLYGAMSRPDGEYVLEGVQPGHYRIATGEYRSAVVQVSGDTVFDIDIPDAHLSGRVLEGDSKVPVVGADIQLWPAQTDSPRIRLGDQSDHFGHFALTGLEPGDFMLAVYRPGYEMFRERISFGSSITDMTIRLRASAGVDINVREAGSGRPLREIVAMERIGERHGASVSLILDERGSGSLPAALAGTTLTIAASGYQPAIVRDWNGTSLELELAPEPTR